MTVYILMNEYHNIVGAYRRKSSANYWQRTLRRLTGMGYYVVNVTVR